MKTTLNMTEDVQPPEKLMIGMEKPCLDELPAEVAARIEDMWRVGSMLSHYSHLERERQRNNNLLGEAISLSQRMCWNVLGGISTDENVRETLEKLDTISHQSHVPVSEEPKSVLAVNFWVNVSDADTQRLSCESRLIFLQMAIDRSSNDKEAILRQYPLLDCLRRIRRVVVHCKPIDVKRADCHTVLFDPSDPNTSQVTMRHKGAWFFSVKPEDVKEDSRSCKYRLDSKWIQWFVQQCDQLSASLILHAAVEQICEYYSRPIAT